MVAFLIIFEVRIPSGNTELFLLNFFNFFL